MRQTREIKNFIFSQYFSDGLRITFGVLLPPLIFSQLGLLIAGITVSLGAITTSIPDNPGPLLHKRNGMLASIVFMILTALITGLINPYPFLLVAEIFLLCFFFSMFNIYGSRASAVGTGVLIVMVLNVDRHFTLPELFKYLGLLLTGGIWYMSLSLAVSQLFPYRIAQHALGECVTKVADYLKLKANFYDPKKELEDNYKKLVDQQIVVHQQQDVVRELLFKSRMITKDTSKTARLLVLIFSDIVDVFEQIMATHYDYKAIRSTYANTGVLKELESIIRNMGNELENLGNDINANERPRPLYNFQTQLEQLKYHIDLVPNNLALKKILINARNIIARIDNIYNYFKQKKLDKYTLSTENELGRFVSHQSMDLKDFLENLSFKSSVFKHSLRVAIVCVIGFLASKFTKGEHSYWILLTILVILKPAFSLTKERNYQRLIGTFVGGIAGALVIHFVQDDTIRFAFLLIFMIGAYSFQRLNYVVSVLFMTPFILIMLSFIGFGSLNVVRERIIDTFIGSFIALIASYFIFPSWEYPLLKKHMRNLLIANYNYLAEVAKSLTGQVLDVTEYKLIRKEVYVQSANMASALQRMLSEPKNKQRNAREVQKFLVLNHTLSSYIATLITTIKSGENSQINPVHLKLIRRALYQLCEAISKLKDPKEDDDFKELEIKATEASIKIVEESIDSKLITEQLEFVNQAAGDLLKISQRLDESQVPAKNEHLSESIA